MFTGSGSSGGGGTSSRGSSNTASDVGDQLLDVSRLKSLK